MKRNYRWRCKVCGEGVSAVDLSCPNCNSAKVLSPLQVDALVSKASGKPLTSGEEAELNRQEFFQDLSAMQQVGYVVCISPALAGAVLMKFALSILAFMIGLGLFAAGWLLVWSFDFILGRAGKSVTKTLPTKTLLKDAQ